MRIQTFKPNKGLIHGADPMRIGCDQAGTLRIANTEVVISPETNSVMPVLANGSVGVYKATFTATDGTVYELEKVTVRGGRIVPPDPTAVEFMELRCRLDVMEAECNRLREQIRELANIFDTNSLNFLIN